MLANYHGKLNGHKVYFYKVVADDTQKRKLVNKLLLNEKQRNLPMQSKILYTTLPTRNKSKISYLSAKKIC